MEEKSIEFLSRASKVIPKEISNLRTHYLLKAKSIAESSGLRLPRKVFGDKSMCRFCGNLWSNTKNLVRLAPKIVPGKRMKKILRRKEKCPQLLRPYELKLLKKCETNKDNKLVMICGVCHKKTCVSLTKPAKMKPIQEEDSLLVTPVKSKKKRKSKDIFAGLNSSIVSSVTPNILSNRQSAKKIKHSTPNDHRSSKSMPFKIEIDNPLPVVKTPFTPLIQKKMSMKKQVEIAREEVKAEKKKQLKNSTKKVKRYNTLQKLLASEANTPLAKTSLKDFLSSV